MFCIIPITSIFFLFLFTMNSKNNIVEIKCREDYLKYLKDKIISLNKNHSSADVLKKDCFREIFNYIDQYKPSDSDISTLLLQIKEFINFNDIYFILGECSNRNIKFDKVFIDKFLGFPINKDYKDYKDYSSINLHNYTTYLQNLLHLYSRYIEDKDSMALRSSENQLDNINYLIDDVFHYMLTRFNYKRHRFIKKSSKGLYLVVCCKIVNMDTITYNYVKYSDEFRDCLFSYILVESLVLRHRRSSSITADYVFCVDTSAQKSDPT